jgi:hypothetical protein
VEWADPDNFSSRIFVFINTLIFFLVSSVSITYQLGFGILLATFFDCFHYFHVVFMVVVQTDVALIPIFLLPCLAACLAGGIAQAQAHFLKGKIRNFSGRSRYRNPTFLNTLFLFFLVVGISLGGWLATLAAVKYKYTIWVPATIALVMSLLSNVVGAKAAEYKDDDGLDLIRALPTSLIEGSFLPFQAITTFREAIVKGNSSFQNSDLSRSDFAFTYISNTVKLDGANVSRQDAIDKKEAQFKRAGDKRIYNFFEVGGHLLNLGNLSIQSDAKQEILASTSLMREEDKIRLEALLNAKKVIDE